MLALRYDNSPVAAGARFIVGSAGIVSAGRQSPRSVTSSLAGSPLHPSVS